jgi:crotonobetainyl-CoA:carnitine CoA-transferase CaiB-like acyl-CoA transferase
MPATHILDGITVVDLTQFIAGPIAGRTMAEMGAGVIKVELAPDGDQARTLPVIKNGRSAYYVQQNQGKLGLCLNLRDERGREALARLLAQADVFIENLSPGAIGRLGFGWETVHGLNPELIMCSISAFGQTGPLANQPGFDYIAQGYTGVSSMIGEPGEAPPLAGVALGDVGTAVAAVAAINGALFHRARHGGGGQYLDIALIDFYFLSHSINVEAASVSGGAVEPTRTGSHHQHAAPTGFFAGPDGHIVILAVTDDMWRRLARAMARPELADDPRFARRESRIERRAELNRLVESWLAETESVRAACAALQAERVPCAPVLTVAQAMAEPHLIERGTAREVDDPSIGRFVIPGSPLRFSAFPELAGGRAPYLGEHNAAVLIGRLGYTEEEVRRLVADGVLVAEPLPAEVAAE